jgi:DNA-binding transcriptional LysR family regulator
MLAINASILIRGMSESDPLDIDGRLLALLVAVVDERSITRAAERLGVTQSAVSHGLDRLRAIVGDALVVKSGRGVVPTARAALLADRARQLVDGLRALVYAGGFDPALFDGTIQIAANALQRDLLLPAMFQRLHAAAPRLSLRIVPSDVPSAEMLRDARCHLVLSPRPPPAGDIVHKRLFDDDYRVFFDATERSAPTSREDYELAEHVTVLHGPQRALEIDRLLDERTIHRRVVVQVADFSGVRPFVRGSRRLATLPGLLRVEQLKGLAHAPLPFECPAMPMYMMWHARHQADPMHHWLRATLEASVAPALASVDPR